MAAMDVDLYEWCRSCRKPLCLIEETLIHPGFWKKATRNVKELAKMIDVPAYLVVTDNTEDDYLRFAVREIYPSGQREFSWLSEDEMADFLTDFHRPCMHCGFDATAAKAA